MHRRRISIALLAALPALALASCGSDSPSSDTVPGTAVSTPASTPASESKQSVPDTPGTAAGSEGSMMGSIPDTVVSGSSDTTVPASERNSAGQQPAPDNT